MKWKNLILIALSILSLSYFIFKSHNTAIYVSGSNFPLLIVSPSSLELENDISKYLIINVTSGLLNSTIDSVQIDDGGGYLTFVALNESQLNITYTNAISSARISGHNGTIDPIPIDRNGATIIYINTGNSVLIQWDVLLEEYVPFLFILGMIGLVALMGSPLYGIYAVRKRDRDSLVTALIMGCIGFGLFIAWLWGV